MLLEYRNKDKHTLVRFSPTEVASLGLPLRRAYVEYDQYCRLHNYDMWLQASSNYEKYIDALVAQADALLDQPVTKH